MYSDADAAALYDRLNPWGPSDDFYLSFVMDAPDVAALERAFALAVMASNAFQVS
jgi:hypothetical protein